MEEVTVVRHRVLVEGASRREVARALGISRNTVKRYLEGAPVGERKATPRERPALARAQERMDALLEDAPRWTGGKQRLTATQLHRLLRREGIRVGVTLVKDYVREWKRRRAEVFVPLMHKPGDLGQVDFFEVLAEVAGKRVKAFMFLLRAMYLRIPAKPITRSAARRSPVPEHAEHRVTVLVSATSPASSRRSSVSPRPRPS